MERKPTQRQDELVREIESQLDDAYVALVYASRKLDHLYDEADEDMPSVSALKRRVHAMKGMLREGERLAIEFCRDLDNINDNH